jgi:magnesium transporter
LLFEDKLLCFTEGDNRFVDRILSRLADPLSPLAKRGHDYLFYVLYDMIVDDAMNVADHLALQIETMETDLLHLSDKDQMTLYGYRQKLAALRSMANQLLVNAPKDSFKNDRFIAVETYKYYDDVYDHLHRLHHQVLLGTEQVGHMLDVYLNQASHRMNQIMMTLTIFSVIFIPLSFLAGVFGMNFTNFPILGNPYGLLYFTLVCLAVPIGMLLFFKWKKWF